MGWLAGGVRDAHGLDGLVHVDGALAVAHPAEVVRVDGEAQLGPARLVRLHKDAVAVPVGGDALGGPGVVDIAQVEQHRGAAVARGRLLARVRHKEQLGRVDLERAFDAVPEVLLDALDLGARLVLALRQGAAPHRVLHRGRHARDGGRAARQDALDLDHLVAEAHDGLALLLAHRGRVARDLRQPSRLAAPLLLLGFAHQREGRAVAGLDELLLLVRPEDAVRHDLVDLLLHLVGQRLTGRVPPALARLALLPRRVHLVLLHHEQLDHIVVVLDLGPVVGPLHVLL
mmetsp:Transcript_15138/g.38487  ORF Transcript_15138/g.38487 Transcript_15138/m.38487 type:complete len:287 (-) Transcript_15138:709-1569(-)